MPVKRLPSNPNLAHLKYQAKDLLKGHAARSPEAAQRIREFHPRFQGATDAVIFAAEFRLSAAQLTIAREHGFPSWMRLKQHTEKSTRVNRLDLPHHERIEDDAFRQAVALIDAGDEAGLRSHLQHHPAIQRRHVVFEGGNYFRNPTLLNFIAENPIRQGTMPQNIVAVAEVILDAGVDHDALNETLMLVATGRVPRACRVQIPLIDLLCDHGADATGALQAAAGHGEFQSVQALLRRGAPIDLAVAAAMGRVDDFRRLLPASHKDERHLALAMSSQFGHSDIVRMLLDAGEDPSRYNPLGSHSHSTPLHQAALAGHDEIVRLLIERGARVDVKDILWHGTPADWAQHAGNAELEAYLRALQPTTAN